MVDFEYKDQELSIIDLELPNYDNETINICQTIGGLTVMIDRRYELVPANDTDTPGLFVLQKKKKGENARERDKKDGNRKKDRN